MGPVHNFAALATNARRAQRPDQPYDPRLAPSETDLEVDDAFESHPGVQELMRELDDWYAD